MGKVSNLNQLNQTEKNITDKKNSMFDNKLKQKGLIDFVRKSDYINGNTEIKLFHIKCRKEISVKPNYFLKEKINVHIAIKRKLKRGSILKMNFFKIK